MYRNWNRHEALLNNFVGALILLATPGLSAQDDLRSWNDSASRTAILDFVKRVTDESGPDYRSPKDRVVVFDNDGTLWSEKPFYFQAAFAFDRVKALAKDHPEWNQQEPYKSVLAKDLQGVLKSGHEGIAEIIAATHSNITTDEFDRLVRDWMETARHPTTGRLYRDMVFQPMLELLRLLRHQGFEIWIVSGSGMEFLRVWADEVYGIPPERVIGSYTKLRFEDHGADEARPRLVRVPEIEFVNDGEGKVIGIHRFIRRQPIAAFGNSDGDLQMLKWTTSGPGATLGVLLHHTDAEREWAYDKDSATGKLDVALTRAKTHGWAVVDMKTDWKDIFQTRHPYLHKKAGTHASKWSYEGETGPPRWGDLSPDYRLAKTGLRQSPIDIRQVASERLPMLSFRYRPTATHLVYNGHTIQESQDAGSSFTDGVTTYELQQFHFHSPSEHTVNGNHFPMEMHLVHKSATGEVAVVAVFIREGKHNTAFDPAWRQLPDAGLRTSDSPEPIDTAAMLPKARGYYAYDGSFTTPPCTEQVKWFLLSEPVELSRNQIDRFRATIDHNNRPVQPLNGRTIHRSGK